MPETAGPPMSRLEDRSLKAQCVEAIERLIISGDLPVGSELPPERELAKRLGVSRPVVHEALVAVAAKGFVEVQPRRGTRVADFYRHGTLAIFESLIMHSDGRFPDGVLHDLLAFRALIEIQAVRLAAERGGGEELAELSAALEAEEALDRRSGGRPDVATAAELDFRFHFLLAEASGDRILPLVMNSAAPVYRRLIGRFYEAAPELAAVRRFHRDLVDAIGRRDIEAAVAVMRRMLDHGAAVVGGT